MDARMQREIDEAIRAGERALYSLKEAQRYLNSAGNWGMVDLFGGGMFSGMMKHAKINNASRCIDQARYDLRSFQRELQDVDGFVQNFDAIGDFLTFADFFFDGFLADMMVQSKISKMKNQVSEAIRRVENVLRQLRRQRY